MVRTQVLAILALLGIAGVRADADSRSVELKLEKGESLWQSDDKDVKNPTPWKGSLLFVVQTSEQPEGKVGGVVRAIGPGGRVTTITKWQTPTTAGQWAIVKVRNGKAALSFGTKMNLKTRDNGYDAYIELIEKGGAITVGRTWNGTRIAKRPKWAEEIDPASD